MLKVDRVTRSTFVMQLNRKGKTLNITIYLGIFLHTMSHFPDFSRHNYQIVEELGRNREGGRISYLASQLDSAEKIVIKQFRFAADANWQGFKAYQREIEILQQLNHSRIPKYIDSFETQDGFCMVQEYKNAPSLAHRCSFTSSESEKIAVSILEILVYLQTRTPPIIHRDIKPENILLDAENNAYLIDFGISRLKNEEFAASSVAAGTPGFMPPEELFGRPLTTASDLYSLGATLICLLTNTSSIQIDRLIDENYRFKFKHLVPQIDIKSSPPPSTYQGTGYAAGCYALAGKIDKADSLIAQLPSNLQASATYIVFNIGHPVADAGDDESARPIMALVIKYWPDNYMAMYHLGISEYALHDYQNSKQHLNKFLQMYQNEDSWRQNALTVLDDIDRGVETTPPPSNE